jgi:dihydroorotase/N-acyl-D-amino-acid deacylase
MGRFTGIAAVGLGLGLGLAVPARAADPPFDLVFRDARVVDGSGNPWFRADVAVNGDRIAAVGLRLGPGKRELDLRGLVLAPGFVDTHSHFADGIAQDPTARCALSQGVTTLFEGPDGSSPLPLRDFLAGVEALRPSVNLGSLVGQGSIREHVMGLVDRKAREDELLRMKALVREAMDDGAFGLSTGLFYLPGTFTPTAEVVELARIAGERGGIHTSHMRDEAAGVLESVRETIEIGERGGLPTQVTHHKLVGRPNWGRSALTLQMVAEARARGVDVTIDQYPYTASSTGLEVLTPPWAREGGREKLLARLRQPEARGRIREAAVKSIREDRGGGDPRNIKIAACEFDRALAGKSLAELTLERDPSLGPAVTIEAAAETALALVEQGSCAAIFHAISEEDVERIMVSPFTMIASDGEVPVFGEGVPHPRSYGTFARVLGRYVRERGLLSLEEAVRKMTALPAARFGLRDRGLVREGHLADLVVFDPGRILDRATFEAPHQYAEGVRLVLVNGVVAFEEGRPTAARAGRVLRGPGARPPAVVPQ